MQIDAAVECVLPLKFIAPLKPTGKGMRAMRELSFVGFVAFVALGLGRLSTETPKPAQPERNLSADVPKEQPKEAADGPKVDETLAGRFLRVYWFERGAEHGNLDGNTRFRVNAPEVVIDPTFAKRRETTSSGMLQILMKEDLRLLAGAELYCELWGGHPGTANRRVTLNGRSTYPIPAPGGDKQCTHLYPTIPLKVTDLVSGHNALQFACDQGASFWGHFIVDNACLRARLRNDHPDLKKAGLDGFQAKVKATAADEKIELSLDVAKDFSPAIAAVDFQGYYSGYDDNGAGQAASWHGFTKQRQPAAYIGRATQAPFAIAWDLSMLPAQKDMAVRAVVHFKDQPSLVYASPATRGLSIPKRRDAEVGLYVSKDLPEPFWSRAGKKKTCTIRLDIEPTQIERAELHVVTWDGGAGQVKNYFTLNGHALPVAGNGKHDVLYSRLKLDPKRLRKGDNTIELLSDTEHHGIEVLMPGPALTIRRKGPPAERPPAKADPDALRRAATNGGKPDRGKTVFFSSATKCSSCHKVHGQGGESGPDLSQIGGKFDRTHLIESILDPSAEVLQGYQSTIIACKSGRVFTGIVKSESATAVTLVDAENKAITIPMGDIESRAVSKASLMPTELVEAITPAEFRDLIAYLETLRTGRKPTPGEGVTGALTLPPGFRATVVATGLTGATAMDVAPDGRIFLCEQTGALRVIKDGKLLPEPFVKLPVEATWERGLIGVTVAPDFPKTPYVFVCYVAAKPYPHHVVSRFTAQGDVAKPDSEFILFEGDDQTKLGGNVPAGHQGGALHFGKDGKLYIAIGDQTSGKPAQELNSLLGRLLRINPDGSIPDDNPFASKASGKYRATWAFGLRNPFTLAVQPETGRLFINDVGGQAEEINEGIAGANYGWPTVEHGPTTDPRFRGPVHHYPTACITGGAFAPTNLPWPKEYGGQYFFGDFNHGWIKTIDPAKPARANSFATGIRRLVDLRFASDGSLYVLVRDAWVIDKLFKGDTGALLRIQHTGK